MKQSITSLNEQYLRCSGNRESTKESKRRALRFFIRCHGEVDVTMIKYCHGEDYRNFLFDRDNCEKTINLYIAHIKSFLKWLVKREFVRLNPWSELMALPAEDKLTEPFDDEEVLKLFEVAFLRWQILVLLGYCSGLRQSESINLRREDFCFEKERVEVRSKKVGPDSWKWDIKNRKMAYVPFPEYLCLTGRRIEYHRAVKDLFSETSHPYPLITRKRYESAIKAQKVTRDMVAGNFDRQFKTICRLAGVRRGSYQGLRVSFVRKLRDANYDPKQTQILARHKSLNTTMRYYAFEDDKELVTKAVDCFKIL